MKRILATGPGYTVQQFKRLAALGFEVVSFEEISPSALTSILPTVDTYILGGNEHLDAAAIAQADSLRTISFVGTGCGAFVDELAATAKGITVLTTPNITAPTVAEHTVGLLLGLVRGLFAQNEGVKRLGVWQDITPELASIPVGIVGMGAIGTRVAKILVSAFGCEVCYTSRSRKLDLERELNLTYVDLETLFATCGAILLLVPTTQETTNLVDAPRLAKSRPGLFLVNTASPFLVEPGALKSALESGLVAGAAFDGYWMEPPPSPKADPFGLLDFPDRRFILTPHTAAKAPDIWNRMVAFAVDNAVDALAPAHQLP